MVLISCNWPNCSKQFNGQKQYKEHLKREHIGEQEQKASDMNGSTSQQAMVVSEMDKKQIFLPVETWVDILLCISRIELAQTVSLTNWLFNAISRPRIDEHNKRIVPPLLFTNDGNGRAKLEYLFKTRTIPIAQVHPPINIIGFKRLHFRYIDDQIFKFIRLIKPILGTNIWTDFQMRYSNEMPNCVHQFYDIIKGNVSELAIFFNGFNLLNLEFLKTIQFVRLWSGKAINEHILEWMHFPLDENKLRYIFMHIFDINQMAEICKKRFLESTVPVSFIFHFDSIIDEPTLFSIENHQTGEQLILGWYYDEERSYFMLNRSKIGDDQGWREIMRKRYNPDENKTELRIDL